MIQKHPDTRCEWAKHPFVMYRACQLTRFAPPAYVGIERKYVPGGGDFPCLKFHGLSFPAARATASTLHGRRWRLLLDEPAEYRWRMVHGSPGPGSPGVRGNTSNQRMLAPEAARFPRGSPFTLTKDSHPSRYLAERLPRPGARAFVGVPEGHGGDHLRLLTQPGAQFFVGVENVTDPQRADSQVLRR